MTARPSYSGIQRWPANTIVSFDNASDMIEFMFGPPQHDYHVKTRHIHLRQQASREWCDRAAERVRVWVEEMHARHKAEDEANAPLVRAMCKAAEAEFESRWAERMADAARRNAEERRS